MHEQNQEPPSPAKSEEGYLASMLPPANPIIPKGVSAIDERVNFKLEASKDLPLSQSTAIVKRENKGFQNEQQSMEKKPVPARKLMEKMTLTNGYQPSTLIFMKYNNKLLNRRANMSYFSSIFVPFDPKKPIKMPEYWGMLAEDDSLIFDSNFESANLMAVYKIDSNTYDLILQNDVNTKAFTQWFNFKITNKRSNFVAKFNIVNLYKTKSLYNMGMKPAVQSEKSDKGGKKVWRRKGFDIYYDKNDLHYQDNDNKFYKTLSFTYDFTVDKDTVHFAHCLPYDLTDLKKLLQSIKEHAKVSLNSLGNTIMGRNLPLIRIATDTAQNKITKKALIFLGRQHPGQTPGSHVMEEIVFQLLKNKNEGQFLTWRYDIYIIPMVNMDGVFLGNYRGNFAGFDLNRCWLKPEPSKQPEVVLIKNYIKKIAKKQPIELILDLHGHSRKMGSFFYGNDYGPNYMLFPFVASKLNKNILFSSSKFTHQTENDSKFSTARVVLGNLIKQSGGYVYTYQVSFFGYYKEGTKIPFSFTEDHYKHIGKSLILAIYRTYLEIYKEQKTLKESTYLKNIKGQITDFSPTQNKAEQDENSQSGSDSEAEAEMVEEVKAIQEFIEECKYQEGDSHVPVKRSVDSKVNQKKQTHKKSPKTIVDLNEQASKEAVLVSSRPQQKKKEFREFGLPVQRYNQQIKRKIEYLIDRNMENDLKSIVNERLPTIGSREHLKSERPEESTNLTYTHNSSAVQKSPQQAYLDYLKLKKKKKDYQQNLLIHGNTFELQGKKKTLSNNNQEEERLKPQDSLNFRGGSPSLATEKKLQNKTHASKSHHTIDMNSYMAMSREENDLIEKKPYFQRRKLTSNNYIIKQESVGHRRDQVSPQYIPKSAFQVQRLEARTPTNQWTSLKPNGKAESRVKLPSI